MVLLVRSSSFGFTVETRVTKYVLSNASSYTIALTVVDGLDRNEDTRSF